MAELLIIRHGQASFGEETYDVLREMEWTPDRLVTGTLKRQVDTLSSMGFEETPEQHVGFNEYDFGDLLNARYKGEVPDLVKGDRRTHFRTLRETVFDWQDAAFDGASETYAEFAARTEAARAFACDTDAARVLVISSGGVIGQLTAMALGADKRHMMELNLQIKNTAMTRFMFKGARCSLSEFNATPHFMTPQGAKLLSYS
jgi:broad specificity phosphatase PhoE